MKSKLIRFLCLCFVLSSCNSHKKLVYLQDVDFNTPVKIQDYSAITIEPQDMLSIVVSSKTPELALPFNLPVVAYQAGGEMVSGGNQQRLMGYVVNKDGYIDFPVIGELHIVGKTRDQLVQYIKERLIEDNYINDPVVTVQFLNFKVYVVGEVKSPGAYNVNGDRVTILEALGMAGDATVYGKRENVKVIREKNGERIIYEIDLRATNLFESPVYYLKQNDVVYVEPNKFKARQSTNTNQFSQISLWVSIGSMVATIANIILRYQ